MINSRDSNQPNNLLQLLRLEVIFTNTLVKYSLPILWMAIIFYLSSIPDLSLKGSLAPYDFVLRKIAHIFEYALLSFLWRMANASPVIASEISAGNAIADEIHQMYVPGRHGALTDIGIDSMGILFGLMAYYFIYSRVFKISESEN